MFRFLLFLYLLCFYFAYETNRNVLVTIYQRGFNSFSYICIVNCKYQLTKM